MSYDKNFSSIVKTILILTSNFEMKFGASSYKPIPKKKPFARIKKKNIEVDIHDNDSQVVSDDKNDKSKKDN